jgi:hypothetical protein
MSEEVANSSRCLIFFCGMCMGLHGELLNILMIGWLIKIMAREQWTGLRIIRDHCKIKGDDQYNQAGSLNNNNNNPYTVGKQTIIYIYIYI